MGNATGIYNLMRNIGGSVGIAAIMTLLARHTQVHQSVLAGHITPYDPQVREAVGALHGRATEQQAYGCFTANSSASPPCSHTRTTFACWPDSPPCACRRCCSSGRCASARARMGLYGSPTRRTAAAS